uniref:Kinase D-interacting substrate of 220 kDa-like n=1 Tax=Phallusia mammillata TaxID=59560 RepID=A0A6F9DGN4_9ASCI|nr:kinase D-interacting substrate of 220 kDa-like [Phallusia mammillata]
MASSVIELQELNVNIHQFVEEENIVALQNFLVDPELVEKRNDLNQTALHVASEKGNVDVVQLLLARGAVISVRDIDEFTPLIAASRCGHYEIVKLLVEKRSNIELADKNGWTSLVWASYKGHTAVVQFLLEEGANVHVTVNYNMTSLLWAAGRGFDGVVEMLCEKGAKVNHTDKFGNTSLLWAARQGSVKSVRCLLRKHADPNIVGGNGSNCLLSALKGKHLDCVETLLDNMKLNVNQTDRDGHTALSFAAKLGEEDVIRLLLDRGAFLNLADHHGDTALIKATKHGHQNCVKILLSKFADVDLKGKDGKTALHFACEMGNMTIVKELLACNPNIDVRNSDHETPLVRAVKEGNCPVVKLLLNHGASVAATDKNHDSPIHSAIRAQNVQMLELLLQDPRNAQYMYRPNKFGETAYDLDNQNRKQLLPTLFGLKGFSTASMSDSSSYDLYSSAMADMLSDPGFETPICVGLFATWGSTVSILLNKVKNQIRLFVGSQTAKKYRFSWVTFFVIAFLSTFFGLFVGYLTFGTPSGGIATALTVFILPYLAILVLYFGCYKAKWPWAMRMLYSLQDKEFYMKLMMKICFASYHRSDSAKRKVRFIFATGAGLSPTNATTSVADLLMVITEAIECKVGHVAFRLSRGFNDKIFPDLAFRWLFRKFCCIPTLVWFVLFLCSFSCTLILVIAVYGPNPSLNLDDFWNPLIIIYITSSVSGGLLLVSLSMLSSVMSSLFLSPKSLQQKLKKTSRPLKTEMIQICHALGQIDAIMGTNTRLCVLLDCLECRDIKNLIEMMETLRKSFDMNPIITLLAADYHLLSSAVEQASIHNGNPQLKVNFSHSVIQLPLFFSERKHRQNKKMTVRNGVLTPVHDRQDCDFSMEHQGRHTKSFDLTRWLTSDERLDLINPHLVKRMASIISFSARLLRAEGKDFSWPSLSCWIVLSELWPYTTTCLVENVEQRINETNKPLRLLYFEIAPMLSSNHASDNSSVYALQGFVTSKCFTLTVRDLKNFAETAMNLDPKLKEYVPNFSDLSANIQKSDIRSDSMSLTSTVSYSEIPVTNWSVDEVCLRFKAIAGLNSHNFPHYDAFIRRNNFHGLAIVSCDLDELKKELKAPFGDWCLIRKFIMESKVQQSTKAISLSSINVSEPKSQSDGKKFPLTPDADDTTEFNALSLTDRSAYDEAFKEYLRLQNRNALSTEQLTNINDNSSVLPSTSDQENEPLIHRQFDINAN